MIESVIESDSKKFGNSTNHVGIRDYHGSITGASWEHRGNIIGASWEQQGSIMVASWEHGTDSTETSGQLRQYN